MTSMVFDGTQGWNGNQQPDAANTPGSGANSLALLTSEVLLPAQYFTPFSERVLSPEQRLMLAILEDAVYTVLKYAGSRSRRARRLVRDAERWMARSEPWWLFSFENICAVLGLEAEAVRDRLRRLQLRAEREGSTGLSRFANQHRVVGRQHRVVLSPAERRRLRARQKAREQRRQRSSP